MSNIGLSSGFPGWAVWANYNAGPSQVLTNAWHTDPTVLAYLCSLTPACQGFTSMGKVSANATALVPAPGVVTWVRKGAKVALVEGGEAEMNPAAATAAPAAATPRPLPSRPPTLAERLRRKAHRA